MSGLRLGAASLEDAAEGTFVRARAWGLQLIYSSLGA
jgi:hypothetical protein